MKIAYIGPYRNKEGGWSLAAADYIRALKKAGADLTIRNIQYGQQSRDCPDDIKELEKQKYGEYDVLLQNCFPNDSYYDGRFKKSACLFFSEASSLPYWQNKLKLLDHFFVPSKYELENYNQYNNGSAIGLPIDSSIGGKEWPEIPNLNPRNCFIFYTIGTNLYRKNLEATIRAYYKAFQKYEDVLLVVKTNGDLKERVNVVKNSTRLYVNRERYPIISAISQDIALQQVYGLHQQGDCFVCSSRGESFCRPNLEAMCFGNNVLMTDGIGASEFVPEESRVKSHKKMCYDNTRPLPYIYNSRQHWYDIDEEELAAKMYEMYKNRPTINKEFYDETIKYNSYEQVGERMLKCLKQ